MILFGKNWELGILHAKADTTYIGDDPSNIWNCELLQVVFVGDDVDKNANLICSIKKNTEIPFLSCCIIKRRPC